MATYRFFCLQWKNNCKHGEYKGDKRADDVVALLPEVEDSVSYHSVETHHDAARQIEVRFNVQFHTCVVDLKQVALVVDTGAKRPEAPVPCARDCHFVKHPAQK